jgi:diamine N-acetyltransferase
MRVDLRAITAENLEDCIRLRPTDDQLSYVSPNVYAIAETTVSPAETPLGIYDGDTLVGFVVYGRSPTDGNFWIQRLMIDQRFQHLGYGKAALDEVLRRLRSLPECAEVRVSYDPANTTATRLYASAGFHSTGETLFGEEVGRLPL